MLINLKILAFRDSIPALGTILSGNGDVFYGLIFMGVWFKKQIKIYKFLAIRIKSVIFTPLKWVT